MRQSSAYSRLLNCQSADEVFEYLMRTLKENVRTFDYFVNWERVLQNLRRYEVGLNTLNVLIGKKDVESSLGSLLQEQPDLMKLLPVLLGLREQAVQPSLTILTDYERGELRYRSFRLCLEGPASKDQIQAAVEFARKTGILQLLSNRRIKSLPDYVLGVEVGLDSNARKNRGGKQMEKIVQFFVDDICQRREFKYLRQATARTIREEFGVEMSAGGPARSYDFAILAGDRLSLVEVNCYGGGGSKLKATAGEYMQLHTQLSQQGHGLIWLTEGAGWHSTRAPLRDAFDHLDCVLNLDMVAKGVLEALLVENMRSA